MNAPRLLGSALPLLLILNGCSAAREGSSYDGAEATAAVEVGRPAQDAPADSPSHSQEAAATAPRKIIYTASLDLIVEDFATVEGEVPRLVAAHGGYIANQDLSGSAGSIRRGSWTARIPIDRFEAFLKQASALGEAQRTKLDTKDVTDQYFDTDLRIKNKKVEEQRLRAILEERTGKLEDVLAVEKELARVRGEIEQLEGSLRLLTNLTSLSTITITITQRRDFKPTAAPDFPTRIGRTFSDSLWALRQAVEGCVLVLVAVAPWIPVLLAPVLLLWAILRFLGRRGRAS